MSFRLEVTGETAAFLFQNYEIRSFDFDYEAPRSKYAKGYENSDNQVLTVKGDLSRIIESNVDILTIIRQWAKVKYKSPGYYHHVKLTYYYNEMNVREYTLPDAYITRYREEIDPHTGHGYFILTLHQKPDKKTDIVVEPFTEIFPDIEEEDREWM